LQESIADLAEVRVLQDDAMKIDWSRELGRRRWVVCANLPYNVAVPLVLDMLDQAPSVRRFVVMVQREVGERLAAAAGTESYGAVSVRVAYRASAALIRRVPADVFWPRPAVESIVVRLDRRSRPSVDVDPARLWRVVDAGFAERRKTMRSALRRLGLEPQESVAVLDRAGIERNARAEALTLGELAAIADEMPP
jgi:16S rRNA (adenine1518-N6/adenine1519-N6)-dimethyltransferase